MRRETFRDICRAVEAGQEKRVQNRDLLYAGRVVACSSDGLTVEVFGHRFAWDPGRCRPVDERVDPLGPHSGM